MAECPAVKFSEFFTSATSRSEVVVTFLAMLELIRLKQIVAVQSEAFSEIEIRRASSPVDRLVEPPHKPEAIAN